MQEMFWKKQCNIEGKRRMIKGERKTEVFMAVTVALLVAFGTIFLFLKKVDEKDEEPEIIEEIDLNKIDYDKDYYYLNLILLSVFH